MTKKTEYSCSECGAVLPRWSGKCSECTSWNTLTEGRNESKASAKPSGNRYATWNERAAVRSLKDIAPVAPPRTPTGLSELDRVLGGPVRVLSQPASTRPFLRRYEHFTGSRTAIKVAA